MGLINDSEFDPESSHFGVNATEWLCQAGSINNGEKLGRRQKVAGSSPKGFG